MTDRTDAGERGADGATTGTDRGQLILIAAVLVALTIVASVVLLNSIHASADVQAQQDKESLQQAERVTGQVQNNLEELFLVNGSMDAAGSRAPFVTNESEFAAFVEAYDEQFVNITTTTRTGITNVTFLEAESDDGQVGWQNDSTACLTSDGSCGGGSSNWNLVAGGGEITYLTITITEIDDDDLEIQLGGPSGDSIELQENMTVGADYDFEFYDETDTLITKCVVESQSDTPFEIDVIQDEGVIRTDTESCEFETDIQNPSNDLMIHDGQNTRGTLFVITDANLQNGQFTGSGHGSLDDVITDPAFEIRYEDGQMTYQSTYRPYGGD